MGSRQRTRLLSYNQLVAYNLERIRRASGLTQEVVGQRMAVWTGKEWSVASVSAAERSHATPRVRRFDADDLAALSGIFGVPIEWFFLPPGDESDETWQVTGGGLLKYTPSEWLAALFGLNAEHRWELFIDRVVAVVRTHLGRDCAVARPLYFTDQRDAAEEAARLARAAQELRDLAEQIDEAADRAAALGSSGRQTA